MKQIKILLTILILLLISVKSFSQQWVLKRDELGVKVFTSKTDGSNFKQFRGEVTVKANLGSILKLIDSIPEYPKWMHNCEYSERLKKINYASGYSYYVVNAPWPVTDRDACTYYKVTQDTLTKIVTISITGMKDYIPEKEGRVRIPKVNGLWKLIPVAKGVTKVIYEAHCEIGGYIPATIVNAYITETPFYNLLHLRTIVESPQYPRTVMDYVKEL
jgi:hypothetical protein